MGVIGGRNPGNAESMIFCVDAGNSKSYSGSGTTAYDVISGATATLTNGPTYSSNDGGYFAFDGTNDYLQIGDTPLVDACTTDMTIEYIFYSDDYADHRKNIYNKRYRGTGTLTYETNGSMSFYMGGNNPMGYLNHASGGVFTSDNTWVHHLVTRDIGTHTKHYKNGELVVTRTGFTTTSVTPGVDISSGTESHGDNIRIARGYAGYFDGRVAYLRIYNSAFTEAEAKACFASVRQRFGL